MTKEERQSIILELLIQHNSILVTDLATHLNVSSVTIRKDLTDLEREKKLYRNHGKAILIDPYIDNRNVSEKEKLYVEEKRLIGMKAASLITPKDSILIASGTTMHALARSIVPADELTVITASMEVSNILASEKNIYIIQLGGILRHSSLSVVGKYAENILADFSCSKLFIGVDGIDLDFGITTTNMMEASLNRVMMQTAQKTIVLADSSKFGRRGFSKIADMEAAWSAASWVLSIGSFRRFQGPYGESATASPMRLLARATVHQGLSKVSCAYVGSANGCVDPI